MEAIDLLKDIRKHLDNNPEIDCTSPVMYDQNKHEDSFIIIVKNNKGECYKRFTVKIVKIMEKKFKQWKSCKGIEDEIPDFEVTVLLKYRENLQGEEIIKTVVGYISNISTGKDYENITWNSAETHTPIENPIYWIEIPT